MPVYNRDKQTKEIGNKQNKQNAAPLALPRHFAHRPNLFAELK